MEFSIPANQNVSTEGRDLLHRILVRSPTERLTLQAVMQHPWFTTNLPPGVADMNARLLAHSSSRQAQVRALSPCRVIKRVLRGPAALPLAG